MHSELALKLHAGHSTGCVCGGFYSAAVWKRKRREAAAAKAKAAAANAAATAAITTASTTPATLLPQLPTPLPTLPLAPPQTLKTQSPQCNTRPAQLRRPPERPMM